MPSLHLPAAFLPNRRQTLLLGATLLGGCQVLPDKPHHPLLYDFGPGLTAAPAAAPTLAPLTLAEVQGHDRMDGTQILFRLAYADAQQLRPYSLARWSLPPTLLLQQRLRVVLSRQRLVLSPDQAAGVSRVHGRLPDTLQVSLDEFSHYFESPERSLGLLRLHATLMRHDAGGNRVLAQRSLIERYDAPSPNADGGVKALSAAAEAAVATLVTWVDTPR